MKVINYDLVTLRKLRNLEVLNDHVSTSSQGEAEETRPWQGRGNNHKARQDRSRVDETEARWRQ